MPPHLLRDDDLRIVGGLMHRNAVLSHSPEAAVYLIRDIMYCKPGKVRAMVEKFTTLSTVGQKLGMPKMRIMTDVCAERYWTVVSEMEVASLDEFQKAVAPPAGSEEMKQFEAVMKDYHDLVDVGRREIYKIEA